MAQFQAIIGWKRLRKRENKNYRFVSFPPDAIQKIPKKLLKNSKILLWLHFKQKQVGKGREREKIKIFVPFRSTRRVIENSKQIAKKFKKLKKYNCGFISSQNMEKTEKDRK